MIDDEKEYLRRLAEREKEEKMWPYPARRIRRDEEEQVSLMLTGLREEYGVPLVIVTDIDLIMEGFGGRIIAPKIELRHYPFFCRYLQDKIPGGKKFCRASTINNVRQCREESLPCADSICSKECRLGLKNCYAPLFFDEDPENPIAYFAFGKSCTQKDISSIEEKIYLHRQELPGVSAQQLEKLRDLIKQIKVREDEEVKKIQDKINKGNKKIRDILQTNYEKNRRFYFRRFRDGMEEALFQTFQQLKHDEDIYKNQSIQAFLRKICNYFGTQYVAIFLAKSPQANILELVAQQGLDNLLKTQVHFNWKKSKITEGDLGMFNWDYLPRAEKLKSGLRGEKIKDLSNPGYMYPFELARHAGLVVLGPFSREVRFEKETEREFLNRLCYAIGLRLGALQVLKTIMDQEEREKRAITIPAHTVSHGLNNVLAEITAIGRLLKKEKLNSRNLITGIERILPRARQGINFLAQFSTFALEETDVSRGLTLELQKAHLLPEPLSPYSLIDECVPLYQKRALDEGREIRVDETSLEELPGIKVDPSVMKLALSLMLENAIKYTGKGKYINIWGEKPLRGIEVIKIFISNVGLEIKAKEIDDIFKIDIRGEAAKNLLPSQKGYGLGLPQVKKIIELHGGKIDVECREKGPGDWDHLVIFTITLPTLFGIEMRMVP